MSRRVGLSLVALRALFDEVAEDAVLLAAFEQRVAGRPAEGLHVLDRTGIGGERHLAADQGHIRVDRRRRGELKDSAVPMKGIVLYRESNPRLLPDRCSVG